MNLIANRRTLLLGAAAFTLAWPHVARAAVTTVRLGVNSTHDWQYGAGCQAFADAVAAHPELSTSLKVDVRFNAELGDELAMLTNRSEALSKVFGVDRVRRRIAAGA